VWKSYSNLLFPNEIFVDKVVDNLKSYLQFHFQFVDS
jgi:hypothetical protein